MREGVEVPAELRGVALEAYCWLIAATGQIIKLAIKAHFPKGLDTKKEGMRTKALDEPDLETLWREIADI